MNEFFFFSFFFSLLFVFFSGWQVLGDGLRGQRTHHKMLSLSFFFFFFPFSFSSLRCEGNFPVAIVSAVDRILT